MFRLVAGYGESYRYDLIRDCGEEKVRFEDLHLVPFDAREWGFDIFRFNNLSEKFVRSFASLSNAVGQHQAEEILLDNRDRIPEAWTRYLNVICLGTAWANGPNVLYPHLTPYYYGGPHPGCWRMGYMGFSGKEYKSTMILCQYPRR